eukprot:scaffold33032_cov29-Prasinocladus_malaysianus.AAC.1
MLVNAASEPEREDASEEQSPPDSVDCDQGNTQSTDVSDTYHELANLRIDPASLGNEEDDDGEWETVPSRNAEQGDEFNTFAVPGASRSPTKAVD